MKRVDICQFGAVGDGVTTNTVAIQRAIDACADAGGGYVIFPAGTFLTGTLQLKGNITYELERGCVLKGSPRIEDYVHNGFDHYEMKQTISLLWARDTANLRITGDGEIDFDAEAFYRKRDLEELRKRWPDMQPRQQKECELAVVARPTQPVFFESCSNIRIDGITLRNAPCWTITCSRCSTIHIHHINVFNSMVVPNCDGIHLCACRDAVITDNIFYGGDDCIAVTCITAKEETDISERIVISNCIMASRSAAVRIGHAYGKVRQVVVSNLVIHDSNRGIAVFAGNDGYVEDVTIHDVELRTRIAAGGWWGKGEAVVICAAASSGRIENVRIRGVHARCEAGIVIAGTDRNVKQIEISDFSLHLTEGQNADPFGGFLDLLPNLSMRKLEGGLPFVYADSIDGLSLRNLRCTADFPCRGEQLKDIAHLVKENVCYE